MSKEKSTQKKEPQKKQSASVKAMKYPQAPAPLMDLVLSFLNEHGYVDAVRKIETESQKREATDGTPTALGSKNAAKDLPALAEIFNAWEESTGRKATPAKQQKKDKGTPEPKDVEMKSDSDSTSSSDSNSDSDSDSSSSSSSESEAATKKATNKTKASKKRSPSVSSSSASSSSSDSESEAEEARPAKKVKLTKVTPSSTSSSSSGSDSEDEAAPAKTPLPESDTSSDSSSASSSSDSDSSDADSESESSSESSDSEAETSKPKKATVKPGKNIKKEVPSTSSSDSSSSSSDSSDSDSDSDSDSEKKVKHENGATYDRKTSSDSSATLPPNSPAPGAGNKRKRDDFADEKPSDKKPIERFQRIPPTVKVDPKFASNEYQSYDYADRAHADLIVTKGKGFTKEKNKKKRGSYRGGMIDVSGGKGIKFDD